MIRKVDWSDTFQYDNAYEDAVSYDYNGKKRVRKKQTGFFRTILKKTRDDVNKKMGTTLLSNVTAARKKKW